MDRQEIFNHIEIERQHQERKYGHLDNTNTPYNWAAYITQYSTRNLIGDPKLIDKQRFEEDMLKVAALAVAAIEQMTKE